MNALFVRLLNMSVTASVLAMTVMVLRFVFKKVPRKYICLLWALVALRLVCPISIPSSVSAFNLLDMKSDSVGQVEYFEYYGDGVKPMISYEVPGLVNDNHSPGSVSFGSVSKSAYLPPFADIWLIGLAGMAAYAVFSYVKLKNRVSASIEKEDGVYICDDIDSPFILGIIKPKIYLPSGLDEKTKENVLAHERTHIRRHDHWWKPLGYVLLTVYWFNPLLWIAYILLCKDIESACDEAVIEGMDRDGIISYSESLLKCATQRRMITACPVAFGETDVKGRVKNVLNYRKPAFWIICAALVACIVLAVCLLTGPKKKSYDLSITIPAHSDSGFYYSDEEFIPLSKKITVLTGQGLDDTEVILLPVEVKEENAYEPAYLTHGMPLTIDVEKGGWFKAGVRMGNDTDSDKTVYLTVENAEVRIADSHHDVCPCVMIDGVLYFDTGYESSVTARRGMMDGSIESCVSESEIPHKNNQSNFGTGMGYQHGVEGTVEIEFENGKWIVFATEEVKQTYRPSVMVDVNSPEAPEYYYNVIDDPKVSCDYGCYMGHEEIDLVSATSKNGYVYAWADGVVSETGFNEIDGCYLIMKHSGGLESGYTHLQELPVLSAGQNVTGGMEIGHIGKSSKSTGEHLGFFIRKDGTKVDPNDFLPFCKTTAPSENGTSEHHQSQTHHNEDHHNDHH